MRYVSLLILLALASFAAAECSGYLDILDIGDRNAGEDVIVVVRTNHTTTNTTRTVDVILRDPQSDDLGIQYIQFALDDRETSVEVRIKTSNAMVNGSYRVKAIMRVYDRNNMSVKLCERVDYSNTFRINTNRKHYTETPFILDLDTPYNIQPFFYHVRKCSNGRCIVLNMSGELPENYTVIPELRWDENISTSANITLVDTRCYEYAYLKAFQDTLMNATDMLGDVSGQLINESQELMACNAGLSGERSKRLSAEIDKGLAYKELSDYRDTHPHEWPPVLGAGLILGIFICGGYVWWWSRRVTQDNPHEDI